MAAALPAAEKSHSVKVLKDIHTVHSEDRQTFVDLYIPSEAKNFPVLIFIHGGAWRTGDKSQYENIGHALAGAGIGAVVMNYPIGALHPAHVTQAAQVFGWVRGHASEYGWDPKKIFIGGHSAGGHMAALLTLNPEYLKAMSLKTSDVGGCIVLDGVALDLDHASQRPPLLLDMYQGAFGPEKNWHAASPMTWVAPGRSPFLVLIGANDDWISHADTDQFVARLKRAGISVEAAAIPGRDHFGMVSRIGEPNDPVCVTITEFIRKH